MKTCEPQVFQLSCYVGGRVAVCFFPCVVAIGKPYTFTIDDVYCRNQLYLVVHKVSGL